MPHILVVEDDKEVCEVLCEFIKDIPDSNVSQVGDGLDAWLLLQKQKFDLIITDHRMPYIKGFQLCQAIRQKENLNQKTPLILLSGFLGEVERSMSPKEDIYFLEKPPKPESFEQLIKAFTESGKIEPI